MNDLQHQQAKALKKAHSMAIQGKPQATQTWIDRAAQFWPVSPRQLARIQNELDDTREFINQACTVTGTIRQDTDK
jgi:hypothetical protein